MALISRSQSNVEMQSQRLPLILPVQHSVAAGISFAHSSADFIELASLSRSRFTRSSVIPAPSVLLFASCWQSGALKKAPI
jgi:hypothetical protein